MTFTPQYLLEKALEAETRYLALLAQFPPGTIHDERNEARRQMRDAQTCAAWMEKQGLVECANVGPFMTTQVSKGQRVRVRKGARVFGTAPRMPREGHTIERARYVTVHSCDSGYLDSRDDSGNPDVVQGKITWADTSGYWTWTDINNVELLLSPARG